MWSEDAPTTLETRAMKKAQRKRSKSIDKIIAKDKIAARDKIKLLLLGQPGAGKSTLVKQLRLYSGDAFSQEEVEASKMALLENIVDAIRLVLTWREELALPWENDVLEDEAQILVSQPSAIVLQERGWKRLLMTLVRLWREDGMQKAYFNMPFGSPATECLSYFLDDAVRLCSQTFIPSTSDIIHVYASTCGVCDHEVIIGGTTFQLTEMGGHSLTSLKLLRFFDNVSSIVFMASCADVERSLRHGALTSGFEETRLFFQTIARDPFLVKLPIILLFTKLDLLVAKSSKFDLKSIFPDFIGNTHDVEDVKNYVFATFKEKCGARRIYHHFLLGTDSHKVQSVFADVRRDIRDNLLRKVIPE